MTTELTRALDGRLRNRARRLVLTFVTNDSGATAIEYCLIASGVSITIVVVIGTLGDAVLAKFQSVTDAMWPS